MSIAVKRLLSYIIDMVIIFLIIVLVKQVFHMDNYNLEISNLNNQYYEKIITTSEYYNEYASMIHKTDMNNLGMNIFITLLLIVNFIVIPYLTNGQTIGQKLFKIKIIKENEIKIDDFIGRSVIINGIGYMLFMFIILYLTSDMLYFILINILGFFQIIVVIINGFMVLYSKQHCGIADNFTNTRIEEIK